ncbi:MAG: nucleotidyltransferase family protein [Pseudomonadota bacterium]
MELLPILGPRLQNAGIVDDFSGRLKGVCRKTWVQSRLVMERVDEILDTFGQQNLPVLLRGRAALSALHPDQIRFQGHDPVGILVQKKTLPRALESLIALGWRPEAWRRQVNMFEADSITLFDQHWRPLHVFWHALTGHTSEAIDAAIWERAVQLKCKNTPYPIMDATDAAVCALTLPHMSSVLERSVFFRNFIETSGDWDELEQRVIRLGYASRASASLGSIAEIFDSYAAKEAVRGLAALEKPLAAKVEDWSVSLGERKLDQRLRRLAGYVLRKLRRTAQPHPGHVLFASLAYLGHRLTPPRFRRSTLLIPGVLGQERKGVSAL